MMGFLAFETRPERPGPASEAPKAAKPPKAGCPEPRTLGALAALGGSEGRCAASLDAAGDPCAPCPACGSHAFHRPPSKAWACSCCHPPSPPTVGWALCRLPGGPPSGTERLLPPALAAPRPAPPNPRRDNAETPTGAPKAPKPPKAEHSEPETLGGLAALGGRDLVLPESGLPDPRVALEEASAGSLHTGTRFTPDRPDHPPTNGPPWHDDRGWIALWIKAGATLPEREPVLRAWLAAAPSQPLPRCLAAVELARLAANHGIVVRVQP